MKNNRILFIIPNMDSGGAQRAMSNIQMNFPDNWEIHTLINTEKGSKFPTKGTVFSLGLDNNKQPFFLLYQIRAFLLRAKRLRALRNNNDYKACISFIDSANIANIISSIHRKTDNSKTIVSVRISLVEAAKRRLSYRIIVNPIARVLYKKADLVVAVSKELRNELIDEFGLASDRVVAIPNGFDVEELNRLSKESLDKDISERIKGRKVLFTAGRLNISKNQWHLIRAFSVVKERVPEALLIIAGTGNLEEYLKCLVREMSLQDDVLFIGYEKNVNRFIRNSDAFVLSSGYEGFPNALCEAICIGAPCISTDFVTGAKEILAPDNTIVKERISKVTEAKYGLLTPVCSGRMYKADDPIERAEAELANAIIRMLTEQDLNDRYRKMSLERRNNLDIQTVVKEWISVAEGL